MAHRQPIPNHRCPRHLRHLLELGRIQDRGCETPHRRTTFEFFHKSGPQHPVRHAVHPGRHDCAVQSGFQVALLDRIRNGGVRRQQESGSHRHPGRSVGQRGGQTAPVEESTGGHHRNVGAFQHIQHRWQQQCGGNRAGMAAAFAALHDHRVRAPGRHLAGVLGGSDGRDHHGTGLFESCDEFLIGCQRERGHLHTLADHQFDAVSGVGGVGPDIDAEGPVRRGLDLGDRRRQFVDRHRGGGEDPQSAGIRGRRHQPCPCHPPHAGLHNWVFDADHPGQRGVDSHALPPLSADTVTSLSRSAVGSIRSRINSSSSPDASRVDGASLRP